MGVLGAYFGVRASLEATRTPREREYVVRQTKIGIVAAIAFNLVLGVYIFAAVNSWSAHPALFAVLGLSIPLLFTGFILVIAFHYNRRFRQIRAEEWQSHPELFQDETSVTASTFKEYRSRWTLLGLPLVHGRTGTRLGEQTQPAVGWIAIGDRVFGIVFAAGGVAVGAIRMGGAAVGLLAMGGACVGLVAIGGFALGGLALGGGAIGIVAAGGVATAWIGAEGGLAVAREFAVGAQALAQHANDAAARESFAQYRWMDMTDAGTRSWFVTICWLPMVLVIWQARRVRRSMRMRNKAGEDSV